MGSLNTEKWNQQHICFKACRLKPLTEIKLLHFKDNLHLKDKNHGPTVLLICCFVFCIFQGKWLMNCVLTGWKLLKASSTEELIRLLWNKFWRLGVEKLLSIEVGFNCIRGPCLWWWESNSNRNISESHHLSCSVFKNRKIKGSILLVQCRLRLLVY